MSDIMFYSYPSCTSCRKTKQWLKSHQVAFEERHLFRETPTYDEMMKILSMTTDGLDEIIATRSETFKQLNINLDEMSVKEVVKLLIEEPRLLRRPILTDGKKLVVGYNQAALRSLTKNKQLVHASVS